MRAIPAILLAISSAAAADGAPLAARAVQFLACAPLPAEIPFGAKPSGYEPGFKIWFLVDGADLIGFQDDSLAITTLATADGKDLSTLRNGKPAWKLDMFPKVTDDGKYGIFAIECTADGFGQVDRARIAGSILAQTGSDRQKQDIPFDPAKPSTAKAGPLAITFGSAAFGGGYGISVKGPLSAIAGIEVVDGAKRTSHTGWSATNDERTYSFPKPVSAAPQLALTWWGRSSTVKVDIKR